MKYPVYAGMEIWYQENDREFYGIILRAERWDRSFWGLFMDYPGKELVGRVARCRPYQEELEEGG